MKYKVMFRPKDGPARFCCTVPDKETAAKKIDIFLRDKRGLEICADDFFPVPNEEDGSCILTRDEVLKETGLTDHIFYARSKEMNFRPIYGLFSRNQQYFLRGDVDTFLLTVRQLELKAKQEREAKNEPKKPTRISCQSLPHHLLSQHEVMNAAEAAGYLHMNKATLYKCVDELGLPVHRVFNGCDLFSRRAIEHWNQKSLQRNGTLLNDFGDEK